MTQLTIHSHHKIVILGAGFGGLGMAAQLKKSGINDFIILEKGADIGGVWRDNIYPGAACDTQSHLYCYEFFPHLRVSRLYANQPEFIDYMNALIDEYQLRDHIILNAEITKATWNQEKKSWQFSINEKEEITSQYFIPAWGQLNTPSIPDFRGLENFKGKFFHSARWDYSIDLNNKKVASIGSAASAVQYIPEIAPKVETLTVFQRSANWILPRQQVIFTKEELNQFENNPETFMQSREELFNMREVGFSVLTQGSDAQKQGMQEAKNYLNTTIKDPVLREKLTPNYEYGCKRILRTSDYYPALQLSHVRLETNPIQGVYENGIITNDGTKHQADIIIFGTGFKSQAFHGNLQINGLNDTTLSDYWSNGASAYLGITVPNFPNMFLIYGPNTNLNHNSILLMIELQLNYITQAIKELEEKKIPAITINEDIYSSFNNQLQSDLKETAFSTSCSSWYKNAEGKIINNWSGTVAEYESLVRQFNIQDFNQL